MGVSYDGDQVYNADTDNSQVISSGVATRKFFFFWGGGGGQIVLKNKRSAE